MNDVITKDMILNFPKKIYEKSGEYSENAILIRKSVYEKFDTKELKKEISSLFRKFQEISYMYRFPDANHAIASPSFEIQENMLTNRFTDKTGRIVEKQIDNQLWATVFYYRILNLAAKLTKEEVFYLVETFFKNQSELIISEKLGICKNTLKGIKKSFLVKSKCELEDLFEGNI